VTCGARRVKTQADNIQLSRLYQTGVYFFIMMYTGSNILPIAKFLEDTHMTQAFTAAEGESSRSIIANMLPEAGENALQSPLVTLDSLV
jgi:DnaJ family protein C protein 13